MKPFRFLTQVLLPDVEAAFDGMAEMGIKDAQVSVIENTPADLFLTAIRSKDQVMRGRSWIALSRLPDSDNLRTEAVLFLKQTFRIVDNAITSEVCDAWLHGLRRLVNRVQRRSAYSEFQRRRFEALAASDAQAIERDSHSWASFLHHENPARRCAAILQMVSVSRDDEEIANRLIEIIEQDRDVNVQISATRGLIDSCSPVYTGQVVTFLARLVQNDRVHLLVREVAYQGLFEVDTKPVEEWPVTRQCQGQFLFPRDVDWVYVASCAASTPSQ